MFVERKIEAGRRKMHATMVAATLAMCIWQGTFQPGLFVKGRGPSKAASAGSADLSSCFAGGEEDAGMGGFRQSRFFGRPTDCHSGEVGV